jgi:hypothetical protein
MSYIIMSVLLSLCTTSVQRHQGVVSGLRMRVSEELERDPKTRLLDSVDTVISRM